MPIGPIPSSFRRLRLLAAASALAVIAVAGLPSTGGAVATPTPTTTMIGGRVTAADGTMTLGSTAISAPDGNFTAADIGWGIDSQGISPGTIITAVSSATTATISTPALKSAKHSIFSINRAAAALYGWDTMALPDGSILVGDYWNYRVVHYNADGTQATPFVWSNTHFGQGAGTMQAPFGMCVDTSGGPFNGYVYVTEGSLYDVVQFDPTGHWVTSWGNVSASHKIKFTYPSQCAVNPANGLVYISNQWGKSIAILNPTTNTVTFVTPPSPGTFIQPRGLKFDSAGNLWIGDQGHHRVEIWNPSCLANPWPTGCKYIAAILPPAGSTTFDLRGLAIDTGVSPNVAYISNGENCLVQKFNADPGPLHNYPAITKTNNYGWILNFNNVAPGNDNCGPGNVLDPAGMFVDGARGVAVDANHNVWVGDWPDFRVQVFDPSGNPIGMEPSYWPNGSSPNPPALPPTGGFNGPRGAAFDPSGNMFVTDMYNSRIEQFTPNGSGGYSFGFTWGVRGNTGFQFNYPRLLCWDPSTALQRGGTGALIVANTDSNQVNAWDPYYPSGPKTVWVNKTMADPYGVACDPTNGLIYVANSNAKNIVVLNSDGTQAGTMGTGVIAGFSRGIAVDPVDGSVWIDVGTTNKVYHFASWAAGGASLASFTAPSGSTKPCDPFGIAPTANYLYIACSTSNYVVQVTRAGVLQTAFGGNNEFGTFGTMQIPQGLTIGPNGDLFVVEEGNNRVTEWQVPQ